MNMKSIDYQTCVMVLIKRCNAGLGLEFVRKHLQMLSNSKVVASCRHPDEAQELLELKTLYPERLDIVRLDVSDDESIKAASEYVGTRHGKLHRLINCAAVLHDKEMRPETSFDKIHRKNLMKSLETNAVGPTLVSKHLLPFLIQGGKDDGARPSVIANMSARVSSIGDNRLGGWYSYRSSKTALNQLTKCLAIELSRKRYNVAAILLHPGTCDTDLSRPWHPNVPEGKLFSKEYGVGRLMEVIDGVTLGESGSFFAYDGSIIEW